MFIPKLFNQESQPEIVDFLKKNAFGMLVSQHEGRPFATHIPFEIIEAEDQIRLRGHISRANPQWKSFAENAELLAIFAGPHAYISSSWYEKMNVSTWNYIAVHVYATARILTDDELLEAVKNLTAKYESSQSNPLFVEKMPADNVASQLRGIVGFELTPTRLEGKWKLSQNRNTTDYQRVIAELEQLGTENEKAVADEMKRLRNDE